MSDKIGLARKVGGINTLLPPSALTQSFGLSWVFHPLPSSMGPSLRSLGFFPAQPLTHQVKLERPSTRLPSTVSGWMSPGAQPPVRPRSAQMKGCLMRGNTSLHNEVSTAPLQPGQSEALNKARLVRRRNV